MTSKLPVRMLPLGHASSPGLAIPQLGFSVWEVPDRQVDEAVGSALETGYRYVDTAESYDNEEGVGRVLARTGIARDELFIATKIWHTHLDRVEPAFDASLKRLGLDVLDLYLIHWPAASRSDYVGAWQRMLELQRSGRVRSVGVCNFTVAHLQRLLDETGMLPSINQVELSPYLQQRELRAFHAEHGIVTEAWSPLAAEAGLLEDPEIRRIADKHAVTPAQVALRWQLQLGHVLLTRSIKLARIAQNADVFGFDLDEEDMRAVAALDRGVRTGPDPDEFGNDESGDDEFGGDESGS